MAECEAPMTPMVMAWSRGRVLERRVGERAVSRWTGMRWDAGRGPWMGEEPVQRMSRLASTWIGSDALSAGEMETVQADCGGGWLVS